MMAVVEVESTSILLSPGATMVPFTDQVAVGAGSPLMGTVKEIGRPARTLMSFIASTSMDGATFRGRQMTASDGSEGSLGPALFTATMRNSYSSPSSRSGTVPRMTPRAASPP